MSYKTERDLHRMLRHQELIESSLSFVSGSEDFIRDNDIFPSGRFDADVMRGLRYPNGTGVIAGAIGGLILFPSSTPEGPQRCNKARR